MSFMATNLLDFFFGFGAFMTPALVLMLNRSLGFRTGVSVFGWVVVVPMVLAKLV
jgi:hypothetical protein